MVEVERLGRHVDANIGAGHGFEKAVDARHQPLGGKGGGGRDAHLREIQVAGRGLLLAAAAPAPLLNGFEAAVRRIVRSFTIPAAEVSAFAALDGEQTRIRQSGPMWLVG